MIDRIVKGKFKILSKLGQGGMGTVYLAEQVGLGNRVALKFLKSEFSADPEVARRFLNEAKSYARVAHPNAVALHDFGQDEDGNLFIAMELCEGVDLKRVLAERGGLPVGEAVEIVLQVADVLANAHSKGVVHRDLKPENIMIRTGLRGVHAKVLDFGIARLMDAGTRLTMAGSIAGTPRYMSPEQVEGKEVDHRADIYSLGIVLFEALTGRQPFDGTTITEILRRQVGEPLPHLVEYSADLDLPALDAVVQQACAKKRDDRWPDMVSFARALSQASPTQAHLGFAAVPPSGSQAGLGASLSKEPISGVLPAGVEANVKDATANTLLRGASVLASPQASAPVLSAADADLVVPKSKAPMVGLVVLAVIGVSGAAWLFSSESAPKGEGGASVPAADTTLRSPPTPTASPTPVDASVTAFGIGARTATPGSVVAVIEGATPDAAPAAAPVVAVDDAIKTLRESSARSVLGQGKTEFEVARLDASETYLRSIEAGTAAHAEAQELLRRIATIRDTLKEAQRQRNGGHCEAAVPLYQRVLALNPKVADAAAGVGFCRQGTIDPTMP
jgi:hypothetical protein